MNIERRITIPVVFALLTAVGCTDATASRSDAIERAKSTTPSLASTAPPAPTEPTEKKKRRWGREKIWRQRWKKMVWWKYRLWLQTTCNELWAKIYSLADIWVLVYWRM